MRASWRGLDLEYSIANDDPGPGLPGGYHIEEIEIVRVDEAEFCANFTCSSKEVLEKHAEEIDAYLYKDAARQLADDGDRE